jgi:GntR family transcriptional regulator
MFPVDPNDPRPLYIQLADEVRRSILRRSLRPEDPLPSVRELARDLRLNPNTVQQAYRELEREGLVYVKRGQGTFVAGVIEPGPVRAMVLREVTEHCIREARRAGLSVDELIEGIRAAAPIEEQDPTPNGEVGR